MTAALAQMLQAVRRELLAWAIAGAALHISIRDGFSRWTLAALGLALGVGIRSIRRSKRDR